MGGMGYEWHELVWVAPEAVYGLYAMKFAPSL